jgi:hypothetical protein
MVSLVPRWLLRTEGLRERVKIVSNLIELDIGNAGIYYVRGRLRDGTGLCQKALQLPLESGSAFAVVPRYTSATRAKRFDAGGLQVWGDSIDWLVRHTKALWRENPTGTLVLQDVWGQSPADAVATVDLSNKFLDETSVYYFGETPDQDLVSVERKIASFLLVGAFTRIAVREANLPTDRMLDSNAIDLIARSIEEIFVSAYDREGLVVWRR